MTTRQMIDDAAANAAKADRLIVGQIKKQDEEPSLQVRRAQTRYKLALWRYKLIMMRHWLGLPWREEESNAE